MFWSRKTQEEQSRPVYPRVDMRIPLIGQNITILMDARHYLVRLKDLSASGLCGLTDAPLVAGQQLCFMIAGLPVAGEVRWIRRTLIGAQFSEPLDDETIRRMQRRSKAVRESSSRDEDRRGSAAPDQPDEG